MLVVGCTERGLAGRGVLVVVMMGRGRGRAPRDLHAAAQGVAAAALQAAVGELVAALLPGARSPLGGLGKALIDHTPGPLVDVTVALVEDKDKPLLRGGGRAGGAGVLLGAGALGALAGASRPAAAAAPTVMANAAGAAAGALALHLQSPSLPSGPPWRPGRTIRQVAGVLALAAAAELAAAALLQRRLRLGVALPAPSRPLPPPPRPSRFAVAGLGPLFTPVADFYVTDTAFPALQVDARSWRLRVSGLVEREVELSYLQLLGVGLVERDVTLVCVHNPVGGRRIGTARWLGVPVAALLALAGVRPGAERLLARSAAGGWDLRLQRQQQMAHRAGVAHRRRRGGLLDRSWLAQSSGQGVARVADRHPHRPRVPAAGCGDGRRGCLGTAGWGEWGAGPGRRWPVGGCRAWSRAGADGVAAVAAGLAGQPGCSLAAGPRRGP